jgi:hypothetical protein
VYENPIKDSLFFWDHPVMVKTADYLKFKLYTKAILKASDATVVDGLGKEGTKPYITNDRVVFNSVHEDTDSFIFPRISDDMLGLNLGHVVVGVKGYPMMYTRVCNTMNQPYTEVVIACLRAAQFLEIIPRWECDGSYEDFQNEWELFDLVNVGFTNRNPN